MIQYLAMKAFEKEKSSNGMGSMPFLLVFICFVGLIALSSTQCKRDSNGQPEAQDYPVPSTSTSIIPSDTTVADALPLDGHDEIHKSPEEGNKTQGNGIVRKEGSLLMPVEDFFLLQVELKGSLLDTLLEAMPDNLRVCRALASEAEEALHFQMDTRKQMAAGDTATLVFKEGGRGVVARLYSVRYFSQILDRELRAYYYWETNKPYPEYFDSNGVSLTPRLKRPPVQEYQRIGRMAGKNLARDGIFFLAESGTEVIAPFSSKVLRINWLPKEEEGSCVELSYEGTGVSAIFKGLGSLSVKVNPGAVLKSGEVVGRVAETSAGKMSGFRYLVRSGVGDGAIGVDPFRFHLTTKYRLDKTSRGFFLSVKQRIDSHLALFDQVSSELVVSPSGDSVGASGG